MLVIRLSRVGKKNQPEYRLIINEKHKDPWGNALEYLGYYNPRTEPPTVTLKVERIKYWLSQGAQTSGTVKNILIDQGIIEGKKSKPKGVRKKKDEKKAEGSQAKEAGSGEDEGVKGEESQAPVEDKEENEEQNKD